MNRTTIAERVIRHDPKLVVTLLHRNINVISVASLFTVERPHILFADLRKFQSQVRLHKMTVDLEVDPCRLIKPKVVSVHCFLLLFVLGQA